LAFTLAATMGEPMEGVVLDGRYKLERKLGHGGMGTVWKASDQKLRRGVAVKLMAERYAGRKKSLKRFEREAMAAARLRSPHIVEVYDYGVTDGRPFMVMELLVGEDLRTRMKRVKRMSLETAARLAVHLGKALATAHEAGTVHRDLKPANIFLVKDQDHDLAKVFDFGIAKALLPMEKDERSLTTEGNLLGTPHYMSPEQMRGDTDVNLTADLWSLGVILYRAVTGHRPFDGEDIGELVHATLDLDPTPPTELLPTLPKQLDAFFERALDKNSAERYESAREMAEAFIASASHSESIAADAANELSEEISALSESGRVFAAARDSAISLASGDLETDESATVVLPERTGGGDAAEASEESAPSGQPRISDQPGTTADGAIQTEDSSFTMRHAANVSVATDGGVGPAANKRALLSTIVAVVLLACVALVAQTLIWGGASSDDASSNTRPELPASDPAPASPVGSASAAAADASPAVADGSATAEASNDEPASTASASSSVDTAPSASTPVGRGQPPHPAGKRPAGRGKRPRPTGKPADSDLFNHPW